MINDKFTYDSESIVFEFIDYQESLNFEDQCADIVTNNNEIESKIPNISNKKHTKPVNLRWAFKLSA